MRIFLMTIAISVSIIGAIIMSLNGCASPFDYKSYVCKDPDLGISSLDYLNGWATVESRGSYGSYSQLQLIEPGRKETTAVGSMTFTAYDNSKIKVIPTLDAVVEDLMKKRTLLKDERVLSKSKIGLHGEKAVRFGISYTGLDMPYSNKSKPVKMREQMVVLYKGAKFYLLSYKNNAVDFDKYSRAFDHIVKSIKFSQ